MIRTYINKANELLNNTGYTIYFEENNFHLLKDYYTPVFKDNKLSNVIDYVIKLL